MRSRACLKQNMEKERYEYFVKRPEKTIFVGQLRRSEKVFLFSIQHLCRFLGLFQLFKVKGLRIDLVNQAVIDSFPRIKILRTIYILFKLLYGFVDSLG